MDIKTADGHPWNTTVRTGFKDVSVLLGQNDPAITEEDLKNRIKVRLYKHQQVLIKCMQVTEENPKFPVAKGAVSTDILYTPWRKGVDRTEIDSKVTVLAGKVGIGKTLIVLAFIAMDTVPKNREIVRPMISVNQQYKRGGGGSADYNVITDNLQIVRYADKNILPTSFIFCNASNLKTTWEFELKSKTNFMSYIDWKRQKNPDKNVFTWFTITNTYQVGQLHEYIKNGEINNIKVVLVKNGTSKASDLLGEKDLNIMIKGGASSLTPPIASQISSYLIGCGKVVRRIFWDDYDTAKDTVKKCMLIPALHHHVVSATNNVDKWINMDLSLPQNVTPMQELTYYISPAFSMTNLNIIAKGASYRCQENFIRDCMEMPKMETFIYRVKNKFVKQMAAAMELGVEVVREVFENINAGNIAGMAGQLGIKAESPHDILNHLFRNKMESYARFKKALQHLTGPITRTLLDYKNGQVRLGEVRELEIRLLEAGYEEENKIDVEQLDEKDRRELPSDGIFRLTYTDRDLHVERPVLYKHPGLGEFRKERIEHYNKLLEKEGAVIDRVAGKLKDGNCPICREDMQDVAIAQCCGATYCASCAYTKSNFSNRNGSIQGVCNNCRKMISIKDYMFVGKDIDLTILNKAEALQTAKKKPAEEKKEEKKEEDDMHWFEREKKDIFREIIQNGHERVLKAIGEKVPTQVKNLVVGTKEPEEVPLDQRKFLVFANFENTLATHEKELNDMNVKFVKMEGSVSNMQKVYEQYVSDPTVKVMTLNSSTVASGLNLQIATDIIFLHKIQNQDIEEQAAGRLYRLGKRNVARVHFILYEDEKRY